MVELHMQTVPTYVHISCYDDGIEIKFYNPYAQTAKHMLYWNTCYTTIMVAVSRIYSLSTRVSRREDSYNVHIDIYIDKACELLIRVV